MTLPLRLDMADAASLNALEAFFISEVFILSSASLDFSKIYCLSCLVVIEWMLWSDAYGFLAIITSLDYKSPAGGAELFARLDGEKQ